MIIYYRSQIGCPIFTLSRTLTLVDHFLRWSRVRLGFVSLLIHIIAVLAVILGDNPGTHHTPTMFQVLYIPHWSMIGMGCFFILILICTVAILALIPINISDSEVKPLTFRCCLSLPPGGADRNCHFPNCHHLLRNPHRLMLSRNADHDRFNCCRMRCWGRCLRSHVP